jgi:hypothetical protein
VHAQNRFDLFNILKSSHSADKPPWNTNSRTQRKRSAHVLIDQTIFDILNCCLFPSPKTVTFVILILYQNRICYCFIRDIVTFQDSESLDNCPKKCDICLNVDFVWKAKPEAYISANNFIDCITSVSQVYHKCLLSQSQQSSVKSRISLLRSNIINKQLTELCFG